jgi:hypothetical protein
MKTIYYSPSFPILTAMELNRPEELDDYLLRRELKRLIEEESPKEEVPIHQAMDLLPLVAMQFPMDRQELLEILMETEEIQMLLRDTKGITMVEADEQVKEEYEEKTFYSFLIDLTNWVESR